MSKIYDLELGETTGRIDGRVADVPDAVPLMNGVPIDDIAVELRNFVQDPIYNEPKRGEKHYLQAFIERLILYDNKDHLDQAVKHLRREILLSDSSSLDAEDEGGISTHDILGQLSTDKQREYKECMCLLERLLWVLLQIEYKDKQPTDVVELVLVKSNLDYAVYKNRRVLFLLKEYDKMLDHSVKYLQWQIFSGVAEKYIVRQRHSQRSSSFTTANSEVSEPANTLEDEEEALFWLTLDEAINTPDLLDELFEAVFPSGSLEMLKYLLNQIKKRGLKRKLECPVLVNAVYWSIYVKDENEQKFYNCFNHALEIEKNNLGATDPIYGDTALHIANDFRDKYMTKKLLDKHPPIAIKNKKEKFPISNISKGGFKHFLDSLITDVPTKFLTSLEVWKIIKGIYIDEYDLENVIFIDFNTFISKNPDNNLEFHDLELIKEVKDSKELWELIDHPVISTLLELHWKEFKYWIILDQFFAIIIASVTLFVGFFVNNIMQVSENLDFLIFVITLVVICLEVLNNYKIFVKIFKLMIKFTKCMTKIVVRSSRAWVTYCKCCLRSKKKREESQDEVDDTQNYELESEEEAPVRTNRSFPVYGTVSSFLLKLPLLILICLYGFRNCSQDLGECKQITGIGIIFLSLNVSLLIGYFSRWLAIDLIMLIYVASTGLKFIVSTFLILLGFAISLTTLIKDYGLQKSEDTLYTFQQCTKINKTLIEDTIDNNDTVSKYSVFGLGIFKTIVMSTGEYEAGELEFPYFTSYLVFICFVFTIPIVFINLLNALAIEDVQKIKKEAMIWYRKVQIMVLYEFEILHKSIFRWGQKSQNLTKIYPSMIGEKAFIGIRTTTREVISMKDVDDHTRIGYLTEDVIENAVRELNDRKNKN